MSGNVITDLVVLGIAQQGPIVVDSVVRVAKSLVPELWQPTGGVIFSSIRRNLDKGYLRHEEPEKAADQLMITQAGLDRVRTLMLQDSGGITSSTTLAADVVQFCFLDIADAETTVCVLDRLKGKTDRRLRELEGRCNRCPNRGRFTNLWISMERRRLEGFADMLAMVSGQSLPNTVAYFETRLAAE